MVTCNIALLLLLLLNLGMAAPLVEELELQLLARLLEKGGNNGNTIKRESPQANQLAAIRTRESELSSLVKAQDADAVYQNMYLPESCIMPPDAETACGAEIAKTFKKQFENGEHNLVLLPGKVELFGDFAIACSNFAEMDTPESLLHAGRFMMLWRKTSDKWYIQWTLWDDTAHAAC